MSLSSGDHQRGRWFPAWLALSAMAIGLLGALLPSLPSYGLSSNPITIYNYYGGNEAFNPNTGDTAYGSYCISDAANVTITVANSSNTVVSTLQSRCPSPMDVPATTGVAPTTAGWSCPTGSTR